MLDSIKHYITETLARAKSPCVLSSFGKDSLLLLHLAREVKPDIAIYFFGDQLDAFAEQFILANDLTVFNYAPADRYLVPNGEGLALVDEYSLGSARLPMVSEIVRGDNCQHGLPEPRTPYFRFPHDYVLWGYKDGETVEAVGCSFEREINLGTTTLVAPLYELTDADVFEALEALGIEPPPADDHLQFCDHCLNAVINSDWDAQAALSNFRTRFQFNH